MESPSLRSSCAAGNAYLQRGSRCFQQDHVTQPDHVEWTWRLPPDNTVLCFAEVWMNNSRCRACQRHPHFAQRSYCLQPTAPPLPPSRPLYPLPPCRSGRPDRMGQRTRCGGFMSNPPSPLRGVVAEHGDWTIQVAEIGENAQAPCLCGTHRPEHGRAHGRQAFVFCRRQLGTNPVGRGQLQLRQWGVRQDRIADPSPRHPQWDCYRQGCERARCRRLHYRESAQVALFVGWPCAQRSPHPSLRSRLSRCPATRSYALGGIRAGGNRSGAVFRLTGTSAAAPQLARHDCQARRIAIPAGDRRSVSGRLS